MHGAPPFAFSNTHTYTETDECGLINTALGGRESEGREGSKLAMDRQRSGSGKEGRKSSMGPMTCAQPRAYPHTLTHTSDRVSKGKKEGVKREEENSIKRTHTYTHPDIQIHTMKPKLLLERTSFAECLKARKTKTRRKKTKHQYRRAYVGVALLFVAFSLPCAKPLGSRKRKKKSGGRSEQVTLEASTS